MAPAKQSRASSAPREDPQLEPPSCRGSRSPAPRGWGRRARPPWPPRRCGRRPGRGPRPPARRPRRRSRPACRPGSRGRACSARPISVKSRRAASSRSVPVGLAVRHQQASGVAADVDAGAGQEGQLAIVQGRERARDRGARPAQVLRRPWRPCAASRSRSERGEVFGLLGPNGAGKTTTVEILEGYRRRSAGEVSVLGHDPEQLDSELRERMGIVLQSSAIYPRATVRESVEHFAGLYRSAARRARDDRARGPRRQGATPAPPSCRAASAGGSTWRWRWSATPSSCSSTSPPPASTPPPAAPPGARCAR